VTSRPEIPPTAFRPHPITTGWNRWVGYALVFAATLWTAWSTLDRFFIGDDFAYIGRFAILPLTEWPKLFVHEWSGGLWGYPLPELRPFAALTFMTDARLWGSNPIGFHATNALLHAAAAFLVVALVRRLQPHEHWLSVAAGLLFAVHPAHAEPIAWITGRVDLLATVFFLAGFVSALNFLQTGRRWAWAASCAAYFGGVFSKEFCLTLPLVAVLWAAIYRDTLEPSQRWRRLGLLIAGHLAVFAVYVACRQIAFGGMGADSRSANFLGADYLERQVDYLAWMIPIFFRTIVLHRAFFIDHAQATIALAALVPVLAFAGWSWARPEQKAGQRALLFFGLAWYWLATLPLVVVTYFSPRHLYFATAGVCVAVVLVASALFRRRATAAIVVALAIAACAVRYHEAVKPWRHAAKVSERVVEAIGDARKTAGPETILLLDIPPSYEGAWLWSWSSPFALRPPFLPAGSEDRILERPDTYVSESAWRNRPDLFAALSRVKQGRLISVSNRGEAVRRTIDGERLDAGRNRFLNELNTKPAAVAWQRFIESLQP
jgi:hypothetical protein